MRIYDLMERNQRQTTEMYHGTSTVFLQSILKNGLMANPPRRVYSGDADDPGPMGYETFGGVYLSNSDVVVVNAAKDAAEKFGGKPMIVAVQYVVGSGNLDEDHVTGAIFGVLADAIDEFYEKIEVSDEFARWGSFTEYEQGNRERVIPKFVEDIYFKLARFGKPNRRVMGLIEQSVVYALDYVTEDDLYSRDGMIELRNNSAFLKIVNELMRSFNDDPRVFKNVQVTRDIGFRGKTRIVRIEDLDENILYPSPGS